MYTADIVMTRDVYSDGTSPLYLRVTIFGKPKYKQFAKVPKSCWTGKKVVKHPQAHSINKLLHTKLQEARDYLNYCTAQNIRPDLEVIFSKSNALTIIDLLDRLAFRYEKEEKFRSYKKVNGLIKKIEDFEKYIGSKASINVGVEWGDKFINWQRNTRKNSDSTIHRDIKIIRQVMNKAVRQGLINYNYFSDLVISPGKSNIVYLDRNEIELLETISLNESQDLYRRCFLFMMYNRGIRVGDALTLTHENIIGNRLIYVSEKNGKNFNIELSNKSMDLINTNERLLFPIMNDADMMLVPVLRSRKIESKTTIFNKNLQKISEIMGISKKVRTHVARHTFAYHFLKAGGSIIDLSHLLGHGSVNTTETYARKLLEVDDLDDQVRGLF